MADLRELVREVHATPGVRGALAAGRDGLLIDAAGVDAAEAEHVAALVPGLTRAAEQVAVAAAGGEQRALVIEAERDLLVLLPLGAEVTVVAVVGGEPDGSAGEALYALRRARGRWAAAAGAGA